MGFAYVTPIATCVKWFPDKRGTITGLAVFGFGAGTLVFGPVINALLGRVGIATTFYILAAVFLVLVSGVGSLFRVPPVGWVCPNWTPPPVEPGVHVDYTSRMMFRTRQFWTLWVMYFFGAGAGLMIIGQAVPIGVEVAHLDKVAAASGLGIMALLNGLGRLAWGSLSDRIGRLRTVMLMFVVMIIAFVGVLPYASGFGLWIVGMCLVGFSFGGFLAVMPSITADFYGTAYLGANYGFCSPPTASRGWWHPSSSTICGPARAGSLPPCTFRRAGCGGHRAGPYGEGAASGFGCHRSTGSAVGGEGPDLRVPGPRGHPLGPGRNGAVAAPLPRRQWAGIRCGLNATAP